MFDGENEKVKKFAFKSGNVVKTAGREETFDCKKLVTTLSYSLDQKLQALLLNFSLVGFKIVVSNIFNQQFLFKKKSYYVYLHWGCTLNYRPLSYPLRSLHWLNSCYSCIIVYFIVL